MKDLLHQCCHIRFCNIRWPIIANGEYRNVSSLQLLEQLHWNASPNVNERVEFAQSLNIRKLHRKGPSAWMNVEWNRIRSFDCANVSSGAEELADIFARAIGDSLHVDFLQ